MKLKKYLMSALSTVHVKAKLNYSVKKNVY